MRAAGAALQRPSSGGQAGGRGSQFFPQAGRPRLREARGCGGNGPGGGQALGSVCNDPGEGDGSLDQRTTRGRGSGARQSRQDLALVRRCQSWLSTQEEEILGSGSRGARQAGDLSVWKDLRLTLAREPSSAVMG